MYLQVSHLIGGICLQRIHILFYCQGDALFGDVKGEKVGNCLYILGEGENLFGEMIAMPMGRKDV